jgi:hypothetical protein
MQASWPFGNQMSCPTLRSSDSQNKTTVTGSLRDESTVSAMNTAYIGLTRHGLKLGLKVQRCGTAHKKIARMLPGRFNSTVPTTAGSRLNEQHSSRTVLGTSTMCTTQLVTTTRDANTSELQFAWPLPRYNHNDEQMS